MRDLQDECSVGCRCRSSDVVDTRERVQLPHTNTACQTNTSPPPCGSCNHLILFPLTVRFRPYRIAMSELERFDLTDTRGGACATSD